MQTAQAVPKPRMGLPKKPPMPYHVAPSFPAAPRPGSKCPASDFLARLSGLQQERGQLTSLAGMLIPSRWANGLH